MFQSLFNIFAINRQHEVGVDKFNHCSTVCGHCDGILIAWYSGSNECSDDQSVYTAFYKNGNYSEAVRIGDKTGNPVLLSHGKQAYLIWSKFEDSGEIKRVIDRWKFCSLWIQEIRFTNAIEFVAEPKLLASSDKHLLGRCGPIYYGCVGYRTDYLLPLYDEFARHGIICKLRIIDKQIGNTLDQSMHMSFSNNLGHNMIQPTLWITNNRIHSLSRNFGTYESACRYSYSDDHGDSWSEPVPTAIKNVNSSLHATRWVDRDLLLWNDTDTINRRNLTLGEIVFQDQIPHINKICVLSDIGGYPSMCVDGSNNLHMTFSNGQRKIEHRIWNQTQFNRIAARGRSSA